MRGRVLAALLGAVLALAAGAAAAEPRDWGTAVELRKLSAEKLGPQSAPTFRNFQSRKLYFGAYVYNAGADVSSFWRNVPSLADAVAMATADCERLSEGRGRCTLYAVTVPRGFPQGTLKGTGLAQDVAKVYRGDYARKAKTKGYAAFATSGLGDYGYSWGYAAQDEAENAASLQCLSGLAGTMADYDRAMVAIATRRRANECDVVDVRRN